MQPISTKSFFFISMWVAIFVAACGGRTLPSDVDASDDGRAAMRIGPDAVFAPDRGMPISCAPDDGDNSTLPRLSPRCNFASTQACQVDGDCGCGCTCQCGVCNCNAAPAGPFHSCTRAAPCCATNEDCAPACYGLVCQEGVCVPPASGPWVGTWQGTFSWPSTTYYFGSCADGIGASEGTSSGGGGSIQIVVTGEGNNLTFLQPKPFSGEPICAIPFVVSGNTATLVPGAACVTPGPGGNCNDDAEAVAIRTFLFGSANLSAGTLILQYTDVIAQPASAGPECVPVTGKDQVNVESVMATLTRTGGG